jgi:hypothetical protein
VLTSRLNPEGLKGVITGNRRAVGWRGPQVGWLVPNHLGDGVARPFLDIHLTHEHEAERAISRLGIAASGREYNAITPPSL